jgi:hypothetical protein
MVLEAGLLSGSDHAGVAIVQDEMEVPPSSPTEAHTTVVPLAQCMDAGPQAEAVDDTTTGNVQATLSTKDMPTPREAAKRLAKFTEEVQVMRQPPLINSPPKQKPAPRRTNMSIRSRRIAAQQMVHIPASKRDEIMLMKKMGIFAPSASNSPYGQAFVRVVLLGYPIDIKCRGS